MTIQTREDRLIGVRLQTTITARDTTTTTQAITFAAMHGSGVEVHLLNRTELNRLSRKTRTSISHHLSFEDADEEVSPAYMRSGEPEAKTGRAMLGWTTQPLISSGDPVPIMPSIEGCIRDRLRNSTQSPSANTLRSGILCATPDRWLSPPEQDPRCFRRLDATDLVHRSESTQRLCSRVH